MKTTVLLRWLTSITAPVHKPLLASTIFRCVNLTLDVILLGLLSGGVASLILGQARAHTLFIALVIVAIVKAVAYYLEQLCGHYVAFKALELLRTHVFSQLWPQAPAVVSASRSGDILTSLTRDVDRIEVVYAHTFAPVVSAVVMGPVIVIAAGITVGWNVVCGVAVCLALSLFVVPFIGFRSSSKATRATLELRRDLAHHITDSVFGAREIIGYGQENMRLSQMNKLGNSIIRSAGLPKTYAGLRRALNTFLLLISALSLTILGINNGVSIAVVAGLVGGSLRLFEGARGIEDAAGYLDHSFAAARRLYTLAHGEQMVSDGPRTLELSTAPSLEFSHVSFSYPNNASKALDDISFGAHAGSHTVFVGPSGSGKSTAASMLVRWWDPSAGKILLDGTDIREYTLDSLRKNIVIVTQNNQMLSTTIRENVVLGAPNASEEEIWHALETVQLAEEIRAMPQGLETFAGQGGSALSGGQVQRLCLARAILMKPRVLVLDEFTANLNVQLEESIRALLRESFPDTTIIEVTHRLASAEHADSVVALENGKVIAHDEPEKVIHRL